MALVLGPAAAVAVEAEVGVVVAGGVEATPGATSDGDPVAVGAETGAAVGGSAETEVVVGDDAVEAKVTASEATVGESSGSGEAGATMVEAVSSASTSFSLGDSEETVSETRPEVSPDEAEP